MPTGPKFHLDEHVRPAVAGGLRRRGIDVTTAGEAGLLGSSDADHLAFARGEGRVLVTRDDDFLRLHDAGRTHAGIAYYGGRFRSIGQIVRGLIVLTETDSPDAMQGLAP